MAAYRGGAVLVFIVSAIFDLLVIRVEKHALSTSAAL